VINVAKFRNEIGEENPTKVTCEKISVISSKQQKFNGNEKTFHISRLIEDKIG